MRATIWHSWIHIYSNLSFEKVARLPIERIDFGNAEQVGTDQHWANTALGSASYCMA